MINQNFISVPACILNLSPIEIKTYCAIRLAAERPQIDVFAIAESVNIENSIFRLSILALRLQGFLLIHSPLSARTLLDDLENVPIQIIDQQMRVSEVIDEDFHFIHFVKSCVDEMRKIRQWLNNDDEAISLFIRFAQLAKEITAQLELQTDQVEV